jgi:cathepsin B
MIGWGVENGQDYWLCVNSWNNTWGEQGTFKILMGDCGINDQIHAGLAL